MAQPARQTKSHEQHRALTIRGKSYCNSACVFCIEKFSGASSSTDPRHPRLAFLRSWPASRDTAIAFLAG